MCDYFFAPTAEAEANQLREGISSESISVTGNTVIDALHFALDRLNTQDDVKSSIENKLLEARYPMRSAVTDQRKYIFVTGHRRENFGEGRGAISATRCKRLPGNFRILSCSSQFACSETRSGTLIDV